MSPPSPTLEGFRATFRRPSAIFAEIAWRWTIGAVAWALIGFWFVEYLGTLTVNGGVLSGNTATNSGGGGGGIRNDGAATLSGVTLNDNHANGGGSGGGAANNALMTLTGVTLSNNSAGGSGEGAHQRSGPAYW